jgi:hypothetical protein
MKNKKKDTQPIKKNVVQEVPTDADTNNKATDGEDFGSIDLNQQKASFIEKKENPSDNKGAKK